MPRIRRICPDFWTSEAVVDCAPMTRLLLLGLSNFADDFGVLPVRPRTLRLQVFPGDAIDDDQVRAMIEELVARGLVRRYTVDDSAYLSIVDWAHHQRVGRRARRRYPALPMPGAGAAVEAPTAPTPAPEDSKPLQNASAAAPALRGEAEDPDPPPAPGDGKPLQSASPVPEAVADPDWYAAVERVVRRTWHGRVPADLATHVARWRAEGRDLGRDVLPAVERVARDATAFRAPFLLARVDAAMAGTPAQTIANHGKLAA